MVRSGGSGSPTAAWPAPATSRGYARPAGATSLGPPKSWRRRALNLSARDIMNELLRIRSNVWPNLRMIEVSDKMLGRSGETIRAVCNIYRNQLVRQPMFAQLMREVGRTRELEDRTSP